MFFVTAEKKESILENIRQGGFKSRGAAIKAASRFNNAEVKEYTAKGLVSIFIRLRGKSYAL